MKPERKVFFVPLGNREPTQEELDKLAARFRSAHLEVVSIEGKESPMQNAGQKQSNTGGVK